MVLNIKGYRELPDEIVDLINRIKDEEIEVGTLWRLISGLDESDNRWANIAKTHFEEGFSALVRSIAKPHSAFVFEE